MHRFLTLALGVNFLFLLTILPACSYLPMSPNYQGPPPRPEDLNIYYSHAKSYGAFTAESTKKNKEFETTRFKIQSDAGEITIDYYKQPKTSDDLIFVFPLLGGKNVIVDYFAEYFARHGFDTAIVHRVNDFKNPALFGELEEVFRKGIVRDRIAIDFFEKEFGKKDFGSFGISRGAINVAMTAGVDPRLKYNVMAMGGTDLVSIFRYSTQRGIAKYRKAVMASRGITKDEFFQSLSSRIVSDPKYLAKYIDARHSLLFLSMFDQTVPFKYGEKLRQDLGRPRTVYLFADHYTSILFTQYAKLLLPSDAICLFPFDYIEAESLEFYRHQFLRKRAFWAIVPFRILQAPFNFISGLIRSAH